MAPTPEVRVATADPTKRALMAELLEARHALVIRPETPANHEALHLLDDLIARHCADAPAGGAA